MGIIFYFQMFNVYKQWRNEKNTAVKKKKNEDAFSISPGSLEK